MGAVEEASKAAGVIFTELKGHPMLLAFFVIVLALVVLVAFELWAIFEAQREVNALLSKCVDPEVLKQLGIIK